MQSGRLLYTFLVLFFAIQVFSQAPKSFKYQTVIRDTESNSINNSDLKIQTSIYIGSANGSLAYSEEHFVSSNHFGLVKLNIGMGENQWPIGGFEDIDWGNNNCFLRIRFGYDDGSQPTDLGTFQLFAVPYAKYAAVAGNAGEYTFSTGLTIVGDTVKNTEKDQIIIINEGENITITGDYPEYSIAVFDYSLRIDEISSQITIDSLANTLDISDNYNSKTNQLNDLDVVEQQTYNKLISGKSNAIDSIYDKQDEYLGKIGSENAILRAKIDSAFESIHDTLIAKVDELKDELLLIIDSLYYEIKQDSILFEDGLKESEVNYDFINAQYSQLGTDLIDSRDDKMYKTVMIGKQLWMAENLNYDNGSTIGKCYNNTSSYCDTYGRLYSFSEAETVCPAGWRLPTQWDWMLLGNHYNNGNYTPGDVINSGFDIDANDPFGGLYGGREYNSISSNMGNEIFWWSSTNNTTEATVIIINRFGSNMDFLQRSISSYKCYVRCIKK